MDYYITPANLFARRFSAERPMPTWDAAVLSFRDAKGSQTLVEALQARPVNHKVFWGCEPSAGLVYETAWAGLRVGVVKSCVWGGPQAGIFVEELAEMGVRTVLGFGAAGSLTDALPQGRLLAIDRAVTENSACGAYGAPPHHASANLLEHVRRLAPAYPHRISVAAGGEVQAVYRETPMLAAAFRALGAEVLNMECATLYAAAQVCGLEALWIGHVSDCLVEHHWQDWHVDRAEMNRQTIEVCQGVLEAVGRSRRAGS